VEEMDETKGGAMTEENGEGRKRKTSGSASISLQLSAVVAPTYSSVSHRLGVCRV